MGIMPDEIAADLGKYISLYNITLSKEAKKTFLDIEEFSFKCNYPCKIPLFFSKIIRNTKELQKLFYNKKINYSLAALLLEIGYYHSLDTKTDYQKGSKLYSYIHDRNKYEKTAILDKGLQYCVKEERTVLENKDILHAAMDYFEEYILENKEPWADPRLNTDYITLAHIYGRYDENLWLKFDEIREYLINYDYTKIRVGWI